MSNDEQVSPAIEWVNSLDRGQLVAECEKRHILPDSPYARTMPTLRKRLREFVCEHGVEHIPPPNLDPSQEPEVEAQGLRNFMGIALRFARDEITSDKAIEKITRLAGIAASKAAQAALLVILTKLRERKLSSSEAEAQISELAIESPAEPPEQPIVPPVEWVKTRVAYDPDPTVAERQIRDEVARGIITGDNGRDLLREVYAEIAQQSAPPEMEAPPTSQEDAMGDKPDPNGPDAGHEPTWKNRGDYAAAPMTKLARTQIENDARHGLLSEENEVDLLSQIDAEEAAIQDQHDAQIGRLRDIQAVAAGTSKPPSGGKGNGNDRGSRSPFGGGSPDAPRNGDRQRDNDGDQPAARDYSSWIPWILLALLAAGFIAWLLYERPWDDDDVDTPAGPDTTQTTVAGTQPTGGGDTTPTPPPAGTPGGQPGAQTVNGQAPAWTAPAPSGDPNNWAKTIIETAPEGAFFHRVFNPRLFNAANNWGGADSWFVSLAVGPNSGGAWTSFNNPGQIVYRGTTNHLAWCLGVSTDSQYKDQFMAGSTAESVGLNVRITPNSLVTTSGPQGVKSGVTSDAGDILIELPDNGVVTICVDYTTAAPTHESHVWWGPHDRPNEPINVISQR